MWWKMVHPLLYPNPCMLLAKQTDCARNYVPRTQQTSTLSWKKNISPITFSEKMFRFRSVFMQSVRTNNDLEGWHRGLNSRASGKSGLPFYLLVKFLYREARLTSLQMRLVSERKLKRIQRRQFRNLQTKIFNLWEEFRNGERSAKQLLSAISYLIAPSQWRYQAKIRLEFGTETRYIWIAFSFSLKTFKLDFQRGGCH